MPSFSGTISEFRRYIGPFARNLVQNTTRKHKKTIGKCQRCGATERLQSAHIGRDRNQVIDAALRKLGMVVESDVNFTVDLASFKHEFEKEHHPLAETIVILCACCHTKRDHEASVRASIEGGSSQRSTRSRNERDGCLPIFLVPSDPIIFKRQLLKSRIAEIEIAYCNRSTEVKLWRLTDAFNDLSRVMSNLRSRPDFRKNKWQARGIKKITVRVRPVTAGGKAPE